MKITLIIVLLTIVLQVSNACTVAVLSGKSTPDGRPMIWKNRDSGFTNNALKKYKEIV